MNACHVILSSSWVQLVVQNILLGAKSYKPLKKKMTQYDTRVPVNETMWKAFLNGSFFMFFSGINVKNVSVSSSVHTYPGPVFWKRSVFFFNQSTIKVFYSNIFL